MRKNPERYSGFRELDAFWKCKTLEELPSFQRKRPLPSLVKVAEVPVTRLVPVAGAEIEGVGEDPGPGGTGDDPGSPTSKAPSRIQAIE